MESHGKVRHVRSAYPRLSALHQSCFQHLRQTGLYSVMSDGKDHTGPAAPESSASTSQGEPSAVPSAPVVPPQAPNVSESAPQPISKPPADVIHLTIPDAATTIPRPATTTLEVTPPVEDRTTLLERARHFLASPQIQQQDDAGKRRFLSEKGLKAEEVDAVLRETVSGACYV